MKDDSESSAEKSLGSQTLLKYITLGIYAVIVAIILGIYHQAQTSTVQLAVLQVSFEGLKKNIEDAITEAKRDNAATWEALHKLDERVDALEKNK